MRSPLKTIFTIALLAAVACSWPDYPLEGSRRGSTRTVAGDCDEAVCQNASDRILECCPSRQYTRADGEELCADTDATTADCQAVIDKSCAQIEASNCQLPGTSVTVGDKTPSGKPRSYSVRFTVPNTYGSMKLTDDNTGSMPSRSLPQQEGFLVNPYGHTNRFGEVGVELQILNTNGTEWGCRDTTVSACGALMYANGRRVYGKPINNPWTCDGTKPANCFISAAELDP